jgi:hypothetical protein
MVLIENPNPHTNRPPGWFLENCASSPEEALKGY